ncbi:MAG: hypothetical protein WBW92_08315 [Rhodanobacteraceae bacterium]
MPESCDTAVAWTSMLAMVPACAGMMTGMPIIESHASTASTRVMRQRVGDGLYTEVVMCQY